jgi:hypothetical protein
MTTTTPLIINGVPLTAAEVRRLPVFERMLQDMEKESVVLQAPSFSAAALKAFASCDPEDYVLPPLPHDREEAVRSLEWAGVHTAEMRTARELRAEMIEQREAMRRRYNYLLNRGMIVTHNFQTIGGSNRALGISSADGLKAWTDSEAFRFMFRYMCDRDEADMQLLREIALENEAWWMQHGIRRS